MTQAEAAPGLIPARMLNEFTFCKRLFFLEWVDRLWAPNADTEEGDYHHRRVDSGGGAAPLPAEGDITDDLIARTLGTVAEARALAASLAPPPPLRSSPKCGRCSLVGICLPDEINVLAGREGTAKPRRLLAADPDAHPLYITEQGATVGIDGGRLTVTKYRQELASVRLIDVLQLSIFGNVQITAQAMRTLFDTGIGVFHFTYGGWLTGISSGLPSKNVNLRIRQSLAAVRHDLTAPRRMIAGKIRNARVFLRRNSGDSATRVVAQLATLAEQAEQATTPATLLGLEGTAARLYFGAFPTMIRDVSLPGPPFTGLRNRRPPTDAVNCLLSFCYSLLTKEMLSACLVVGFDPYLGLFHRPRFGRPALALDLAEEFRPLLADSTVLTLLNNREINSSHFIVRAGAVTLTQDGRRTVLRAWERRMTTSVRHPIFDYQVTYRRAIELQVRILAAYLTGELAAYEPLVTR